MRFLILLQFILIIFLSKPSLGSFYNAQKVVRKAVCRSNMKDRFRLKDGLIPDQKQKIQFPISTIIRNKFDQYALEELSDEFAKRQRGKALSLTDIYGT